MQTDQQTRRFCGCSEVRAVAVSEDSFEPFPVDLLCKNAQRMIEIQKLFQLSLKQIQLAGFGCRSGLHAALKLQGFGLTRSLSLQF
jgi:hypothetical protein